MKKSNIIYTLLSFVVIFLIVVLLIIWRYANQLEIQIIERNEVISSIYKNNFVLDSEELKFIESLSQNDSTTSMSSTQIKNKISDVELRKIHNLIQDYISVVNERSWEKYSMFFADTVQKFFLQDSFKVKDVYYNMRWFWKKYPNSTVIFDINSMSIDKNSKGYTIFIPTKKDQLDILSEIRLNYNLKIYYIKDYYALKDKSRKKNK